MRYLLLLILLTITSVAQQPADAYLTGSVSTQMGASSIDLANVSSRDICANTYIFDRKDDSFVSCCSTLIAPNQAYTMSPRLGAGLTNLTIKLIASNPVGVGGAKICNLSLVTMDNLATGLRASNGGIAFSQTQLSSCVVTSAGQPCKAEIDALGLFCAYVQTTGTGFGVCKEAVAVVPGTSDDQKMVELMLWMYYFN